MSNRNKTEPYALTARFTDQSYRRVIALSEQLGLTRHRALQLCYTVEIDVLSGRLNIRTPAVEQIRAEQATETAQQQQQG